MNTGGGFDGTANGRDTGAVSGDTWHVPPLGPASVAVHDDGDVLGELLRIETGVNLGFFPVQSDRDCRVQTLPRKVVRSLNLTLHAGSCKCSSYVALPWFGGDESRPG